MAGLVPAIHAAAPQNKSGVGAACEAPSSRGAEQRRATISGFLKRTLRRRWATIPWIAAPPLASLSVLKETNRDQFDLACFEGRASSEPSPQARQMGRCPSGRPMAGARQGGGSRHADRLAPSRVGALRRPALKRNASGAQRSSFDFRSARPPTPARPHHQASARTPVSRPGFGAGVRAPFHSPRSAEGLR